MLLPASLVLFAGCATPPDEAEEASSNDEQATSSDENVGQSSDNLIAGGAWGAAVALPGFRSAFAPGLATFRGVPYMAYTGLDNGLYFSAYRNGAWGAAAAIPGVNTAYGARLGVFNNNLYAFYRGMDSRFYLSGYNGYNWASPYAVPYNFAGIGAGIVPSMAFYRNRLNFFWPGAGGQLYRGAWNGYSWANPYAITGAFSPYAPAVTAYGTGLSLLYPHATGYGAYGAAYGYAACGADACDAPLAVTGLAVGACGAGPCDVGLGVYGNTLNAFAPSGYRSGLGWWGWSGTGAWNNYGPIGSLYAAATPAVGYWNNGLNMVWPGAGQQLYASSCSSCL